MANNSEKKSEVKFYTDTEIIMKHGQLGCNAPTEYVSLSDYQRLQADYKQLGESLEQALHRLTQTHAALAAEKAKVKKAKNFLLDVLSYDQNCDCGADTGNETQVETCYFHQLLEIVSKQSEPTPPNGDLKEIVK